VKITSINTIVRKISLAAVALLFFAFFPFTIFAQPGEPSPKTVIAPKPEKYKDITKSKRTIENETFAEKSIFVDAKINISLCIAEGNLKITGWERNEIRAFVGNGSNVRFNVQEKSRQTNNPVWVMITASDSTKTRETRSEQCLSGEEIELDVPRSASVNVKGRTTETNIEGVRKVEVRNVGGNISLTNIEQGIYATTYEGDVTVQNSGGAIQLAASNGNIVAFDVSPSEIGDIFKAKTINGAITLQQIEHRQTEIGSTSGSIKFVGAFQNGGQYDFRTQNGTILLAIPEKSSCKISVSYGFGSFNSEIPLQNVQKNPNPNSRAQSLTAFIGSGEAALNLTTASGAIRLKKQ
jgi:hypothetical protein